MGQALLFGEVLEAVDRLSLEDQEALLEIVRRRLAERGRKRLVAEVEESKQEFAEGGCRPTTVDEIMRDLSA